MDKICELFSVSVYYSVKSWNFLEKCWSASYFNFFFFSFFFFFITTLENLELFQIQQLHALCIDELIRVQAGRIVITRETISSKITVLCRTLFAFLNDLPMLHGAT